MSDAIRPAPNRRRYRDGVRTALPLGLADLALGTWFGVLAHTEPECAEEAQQRAAGRHLWL